VTVTSFDETNVVMCGLTVKVVPLASNMGSLPNMGNFWKLEGYYGITQILDQGLYKRFHGYRIWMNSDEFSNLKWIKNYVISWDIMGI
jgi:hypothetical protein